MAALPSNFPAARSTLLVCALLEKRRQAVDARRVSEALDCGFKCARQRLDRLVERGLLSPIVKGSWGKPGTFFLTSDGIREASRLSEEHVDYEPELAQ